MGWVETHFQIKPNLVELSFGCVEVELGLWKQYHIMHCHNLNFKVNPPNLTSTSVGREMKISLHTQNYHQHHQPTIELIILLLIHPQIKDMFNATQQQNRQRKH